MGVPGSTGPGTQLVHCVQLSTVYSCPPQNCPLCTVVAGGRTARERRELRAATRHGRTRVESCAPFHRSTDAAAGCPQGAAMRRDHGLMRSRCPLSAPAVAYHGPGARRMVEPWQTKAGPECG